MRATWRMLVLAALAGLMCTLACPMGAQGRDYPPDMVHSTVMAPVPDGISLTVPSILGNRRLARMGYLDVTAPPFLADPTGRMDSTRAIQRAVDYARDRQMVCFFPTGEYLVSDTIECVQQYYRRTNGSVIAAHNFPCVLQGSRAGPRPVLTLAPSSPGFGDPATPKSVLHFWTRSTGDPKRPQGDICMNQGALNLHVDISEHNPGAVGIRHWGAQGSFIEDCSVDATHGLVGIQGGIGAGGGMAGITVIGGDIGLDIRESDPSPGLVGVELIGQRSRAILYEGPETLSVTGARIVAQGPGPAIESRILNWNPHQGQMCLDDVSIEFTGSPGVAVLAKRSLYTRNLYVRRAVIAVAGPNGPGPAGSPAGWTHVEEYALGIDPALHHDYQYTSPVYRDGRPAGREITRIGPPAPPPPDLVTRHLWARDFPGFESAGAVDATAPPYNAAGDGIHDDTMALQRAIDENDIVFLPKGYYVLSAPLRLGPRSALVGAARHLSVLMTRPDTWSAGAPDAPAPLVQTTDAAETDTVMAFLGLYSPPQTPGASALSWRCGGGSALRDVSFPTAPPIKGYGNPGDPPSRQAPLVEASGHGGGKWYGFFQDHHVHHGPGYRHLLIRDLTGPLAIYQLDAEHARGRANVEITRSGQITIHGLKGEGNLPILRVTDSRDIVVLGYGGNAAGLENRALFEIGECRDCLLANLVDFPRYEGHGSDEFYAGKGMDPRRWTMISRLGHGADTAPLERPVLYGTGAH